MYIQIITDDIAFIELLQDTVCMFLVWFAVFLRVDWGVDLRRAVKAMMKLFRSRAVFFVANYFYGGFRIFEKCHLILSLYVQAEASEGAVHENCWNVLTHEMI